MKIAATISTRDFEFQLNILTQVTFPVVMNSFCGRCWFHSLHTGVRIVCFMPATLSTLRNTKLHVRAVTNFKTHTTVDWGPENNECCSGLISFQSLLWQKHVTPIPITTREAMDLFTTACEASSNEIEASHMGLCVFVAAVTESDNDGINVGPARWYHVSTICRCPQLLTKLANSFFPRFVDSAEIQMFRDHGIDYQRNMPVQDEDQIPKAEQIPEDQEECCICMDGKPTYRWRGCMHAEESTGALICLRCRNRINSSASKKNGRSPCPICRKLGTLVRHTKIINAWSSMDDHP